MHPVCSGSHRWTSLSDSCVRGVLAAVIPAAFVGALLVASIPPVRTRLRKVGRPLAEFLPLHEAEALLSKPGPRNEDAEHSIAPRRGLSPTLLVVLSVLQSLVQLGLACYRLSVDSDGRLAGVRSMLASGTWLYAALRPIVWPTVTVPFDLFVLFTIHFIFRVIDGCGSLYERYLYGTPFPPTSEIAFYVVDLLIVSGLLGLVFNMPLAAPSVRTNKGRTDPSGSPEDHTTLWEWMTFNWVTSLLQKAIEKDALDADDIWPLSPTMRAHPLYAKFSSIPRACLLKRLWKANSRDMVLDFVLTYAGHVLGYASPFFLKRILDALDISRQGEGDGDPSRGFDREARALAVVYAFAAYGCSLLKAQADLHRPIFSRRAGTRVRTELMVAIYDKALKRKGFSAEVERGVEEDRTDDSGSADSGKILNLMSTDVTLVSNTVAALYIVYGAPFEIFIATLFLYQLLGWAAFAGFAIVIATLPLNDVMAKRTNRIAKGASAARDRRMGILNELITAVRFIKFFAWEDRWVTRVLDARSVELDWIIKARINSIGFTLLGTISPVLVSVVSFSVYIGRGNQLTVGTAFTAIALYAMVRLPFNTFNTFLFQLLRSKVALDRIATYLDEEEVVGECHVSPFADEARFGIVDGWFRWNDSGVRIDNPTAPAMIQFELKDINVLFPESKLTLITGPTASGKTALLMALLGELTSVRGRVITPKNCLKVDDQGLSHTISYAAQTPWLRHETIKENILFGFPYDEERYRAVVECCALEPDLEILEDGDATEIGARGVSLSGGQKARVALARAVYAPTKYVLLDDPLSAVDSHTARFLVEKLLSGPLLANRTVILVTHHVDLVLPVAHYLVRMKDGRIDIQDTVEDLRARGMLEPFAALEEDQLRTPTKSSGIPGVGEANQTTSDMAGKKKPRVLVEPERLATGRVKWPVYNTYLRASSYSTWAIVVALVVVSQLLGVGEKIWIKVWGEASYMSEGSIPSPDSSETQKVMSAGLETAFTVPSARGHPFFYIGIYAAIALSGGLVAVVASVTQYAGALRASRVLFELLLRNIVRATMRWYDITPQGRILNRFSKDIDTIDASLGQTLQQITQSVIAFLVSVLTIVAIFPLFVAPAAILTLFYFRIAALYQPAARDIRRIESTSTSPIFADFSETLEGIVTIRAFGVQSRFLEGLLKKVDAAAQMYLAFWQVNRWLALNFQVVSATAVLATTLFALSRYADAGLAGICITSALSFTGGVYWICRDWATLELDFNSVERIVEYLDIPQEPPTVIATSRPPAYWPSSTSANRDSFVVVDGLVVKYSPELPPVLHGISFSLKAGERVGLIGRTGSGKSTLAMSLLRFVEPERGSVSIDGVDISQIGLHDLRSRVTFIPQDATLLSGTLRENLDPFYEHADAECLDVLERVHLLPDLRVSAVCLGTSVAGRTHGTRAEDTVIEHHGTNASVLDMHVSAGGSNLSQGQRQLVAMARAFLRRSAIVVLDEATSSIDFETDSRIQATIREQFKDCLLLTVAHRLRTVVDYDRLLVLDKGELVEFDTPFNLIRREGGMFRSMCSNSGMMAELEEAARAKK